MVLDTGVNGHPIAVSGAQPFLESYAILLRN